MGRNLVDDFLDLLFHHGPFPARGFVRGIIWSRREEERGKRRGGKPRRSDRSPPDGLSGFGLGDRILQAPFRGAQPIFARDLQSPSDPLSVESCPEKPGPRGPAQV